MGNNPTKEARASSHSEARPSGIDAITSTSSSHRPSVSAVQSSSSDNGRRRGRSGPDIGIFRLGGSSGLGGSERHHDPDPADPTARRETRAEREARKREKERELRAIERARSIKEEGVDGGFLVTLGTYTGPEDFSKTVVRQLMIERRLAPFWKGLQDHEDGWVDNQLVAVVRGEEMPEPGPAPTPEQLMKGMSLGGAVLSSSGMGNSLTVPSAMSMSIERPRSPSNPEHSASNLFGTPPSSFRTRARTLVSLSTPRNASQSDMTPTEVQLPRDPYVNGQPLEAFLYKHASECPICFLYYPPHLNKTRCCDQPICSECFVQIKRPDPHPPEHHDDPNNPNPPPAPDTPDFELVSEVATCPFCKQPEFGVTYDPPPFRRGLVYNEHHRLGSVMSAMSSSSSVNSQSPTPSGSGSRRRATSLAADAPNVITTDIVRPDWRKKLDDARAHALRRAAAATALHNAAYVLGNSGDMGPRLAFGRRRRTFFGENGTGLSSDRSVDGLPHLGALLAAHGPPSAATATAHGAPQLHGPSGGSGEQQPVSTSSDLFPGRGSSRRTRIEDLEELMYMEAIRLSLASADEERKKQEKEDAKKAKKEEKARAKDAKKAAKEAKKNGGGNGMYAASLNESEASGFVPASGAGGEGSGAGKGKAPAAAGGAGGESSGTPSPEPSSKTPREDPQAFLEQSRANIQSAPVPVPQHASSSPQAIPHRQALRHLSSASSVSSLNDLSQETSPNASGLALDQTSGGAYSETPPGGGAGTESMFNFRSLAAVMGDEDEKSGNEGSATGGSATLAPPQPQHAESSSLSITPPDRPLSAGERLFGVGSPVPASPPPTHTQTQTLHPGTRQGEDGGVVTQQQSNPYDAKHYGDISVLDGMGAFSSAR